MNVRMLWWSCAAMSAIAASNASALENPAAEEAAFQAAAAQVAPSTVRIEVIGLGDDKEAAAGAGPSTGIVVGADGWIVTSSFTVAADTVEVIVVLPDGSRHPAKIVAKDTSRLVVLLKIDAPSPLPVPTLCPKREIRVGQWAIALGRAWTPRAASVSVGIVSALDRGWGRAVQTDAAVSPANYGGPLIDIEGRVIGMLAPIPADTAGMTLGTELYDSGIGFAVPMEEIVERLPTLKIGRSIAPGLMGISYASRDSFTQPPVIATARGGSPAAKADLRPGDRIVAIDGVAVSRIAELRHGLAKRSAGDTVSLTIERANPGSSQADSERLEKSLTLVDELPPYRRPCLGIGLVRTKPSDSKPSDSKEATDGDTTVAWVWPEGPAAKAGLAPGDVIESIVPAGDKGEQPETIRSGDEPHDPAVPRSALLAGIVAGGEIGGRFKVTFLRQGTRQTIDVVAAAVPATVPEPPPATARRPGGPASIERLEAADLATPATVVLPGPSDEPLGVVVVLAAARKEPDPTAASRWKDAAEANHVAVVIPGAATQLRWGNDDIPPIAKMLDVLAKKRRLDRSRIAVVGMQAGGPFAWNVAEKLGGGIRGVAILDGGLPRRGSVPASDPGRPLTVLFAPVPPDAPDADAARRRLENDIARLQKAGLPVGLLAQPVSEPPPFEAICRWVESLGIL